MVLEVCTVAIGGRLNGLQKSNESVVEKSSKRKIQIAKNQ
jgi:hypothetical protein